MDYKTTCQLPFGAYVQVHDEISNTNTMEPCTTGAINLGPTGNVQGAHKFLSLVTDEVITHKKWTELPVPCEVIIKPEDMAADPNDDVAVILQDDEEELEHLEDRNETIKESMTPKQQSEQEEENFEAILEREEEVTTELVGTKEPVGTEEQAEEEEVLRHEDCEVDVSATDDTMVMANGENRKELEKRYRYDLRAKRDHDYSYRFTLLSLKAGIKY